MFKDDSSYEEMTFDGLDLQKAVIHSSSFELCKFIGCDFSSSTFSKCKFVDCEFKDCNLNLVKFDASRFLETEFTDCKITGVNWTSLNWTNVALSAPLIFESCDLSYSVFNSLQLPELVIRNCKAHDVDFADSDLTGSDFSNTDFLECRFNHTKLDKCDFRGAQNYYISPLDNSLAEAHFSVPDVLSLLSPFKINIDAD
jgi:uncharacterized protein YjbI with pentapeptide repeats